MTRNEIRSLAHRLDLGQVERAVVGDLVALARPRRAARAPGARHPHPRSGVRAVDGIHEEAARAMYNNVRAYDRALARHAAGEASQPGDRRSRRRGLRRHDSRLDLSALPEPGAKVRLRIHTHVREDALSLFGFLTRDEKALFEKLIAVSGIGPEARRHGALGPGHRRPGAAIRGGEVERLVRIPGVGKKTAERMVLELRDKMPALTAAGATAREPAGGTALSALEQDVLSRAGQSGLRAARRRRRPSARPRPPARRRNSSRCSAGRSNWCGNLS